MMILKSLGITLSLIFESRHIDLLKSTHRDIIVPNAGSGRPHHQHAAGDLALELLELRGIAQKAWTGGTRCGRTCIRTGRSSATGTREATHTAHRRILLAGPAAAPRDRGQPKRNDRFRSSLPSTNSTCSPPARTSSKHMPVLICTIFQP